MKMKKWVIQALLPMLLFGVSKLQAANWEPVQNIQQESSLITFSKIVCDDSGNAAAAWVEARNLYVSYRTAGGFWDPPSNPGSTKADLFDMCVDANGNVTIALRLGSTNSQVVVGFHKYGAGWTTLGKTVAIATNPARFITSLSLTYTSTNFYGYVSWYDSNEAKVKSFGMRINLKMLFQGLFGHIWNFPCDKTIISGSLLLKGHKREVSD